MNKTVTVFGSSKLGAKDNQYKFAYELGKSLAENNFNVCTGGYFGIMEAVSKGASGRGIEITGVTVKEWGKNANKFLTKEIVCDTLLERLMKLIDLGDAFIVLQGGTGTLLELAAAWELINKDSSKKRAVFCHSDFWEQIVETMNEQMKSEGRDTTIVKTFSTTEEVIDRLNNLSTR